MAGGKFNVRIRGLRLAAGLGIALLTAPAARAQPNQAPTAEIAREKSAALAAERDHRMAVAGIVHAHYKDQRLRLERAADDADKARRAARDATIARLEGEASPSPDALLELATLTHARARESATHVDLDKAIALYQRFIRSWPEHRRIARAHLLLGQALVMANRGAEARRALRSLVCHDRYPSAERDPPSPPAEVYPDDCRPLAAATDVALIAEGFRLLGDAHGAEPAAEAAYRHALIAKGSPARRAAMLRLAAIARGQKRHETSIRTLVDLLREVDDEERRAGDAVTDLRPDAYADIAESLAGPDVSESEAFRRVQDSALIPQDARWTIDIYKTLFLRLKAQGRQKGAIAVGELIVAKWPSSLTALVVRSEIAELYDALAARAKEGSPERAASRESAIAARMKIAVDLPQGWSGLGDKMEPAELGAVEEIVRRALRRVAADRTNGGSAIAQQALAISDKSARDKLFVRALEEYKRAGEAWSGYLSQDENARDAGESRYWLADAHHMSIAIELALDRVPSPEAFEAARKAAVSARDAGAEDAYLMSSSVFLVDLAQKALEVEWARFERTHGKEGIEHRTAVKTTGNDEHLKVVKDPLPPAVLAAIKARDDYVKLVPAAADVPQNAESYAFQAADFYFLYGQFAEAKKRFEPMYVDKCGKSEVGYRAWERMITMANLEQDIEGARRLAEAVLRKSCVMPGEGPTPGPAPPWHGGYPYDAYRAFEKASKMADGPERTKAWREAGDLYKTLLERGPARDEAPEAAMNGAFAYRQIGAYPEAIALYQLFIKEYGSEAILAALEKGDSKSTPPRAPDPRKYAERVKYLKMAYDTLGAAYVLFFDYRAAADVFAAISRNTHFSMPDRQSAARNVVVLTVNIGDRAQVAAAQGALARLTPPPETKAEMDYIEASAALKAWNERRPDEGDNRDARKRAMAAMDRYYAANQANRAAERQIVLAASAGAKLRRAAHEAGAAEWCKKAVSAFERLKDQKKLGSLEADSAAECALLLLDDEIRAGFDPHPDMKKAAIYADKLDRVITGFGSRESSTAALLRKAELYDAASTRLGSSSTEAETVMLRFYIEAMVWARRFKVHGPAIERAARRLASLGETLGDARLRAASRGIIDPETRTPFDYKDGMFVRARPGMTASSAGAIIPSPLPVRP